LRCPRRAARPFDQRASHALTPVNLTLEVTDALRFLGPPDAVVVTVLAFEADPETEEREQILRFEHLTLVTYD
jgi:hypothetical protein